MDSEEIVCAHCLHIPSHTEEIEHLEEISYTEPTFKIQEGHE